jgi:1-acyl-sn-glycerol-3-phosphate acyltransferase
MTGTQSKRSAPEPTVYKTPQDSSLIPTIGIILWLGWNGGILLLFAYIGFFASPTNRMVGIGFLTLSLILPLSFFGTVGDNIGAYLMKCGRSYFGLTVTFEDEQSILEIETVQDKAPIFAMEPHDILPYNVFLFNNQLGIIPGDRMAKTARVLVTSAIFKIPIMRHVYYWAGTRAVDKKTFRTRLENKETIAFIPGGVQEVIFLDPKKPEELILYLKNRKGFIKLALERGNPIVPVFCFHLDGSYGYWIPTGKFFENLARKIGFLPMAMWGRWGVPLGIPRPKKLHTVFGKPIDIPCEGVGTVKEESVDKYHAIFLKEFEALFERHKHSEGYGDRKLKML